MATLTQDQIDQLKKADQKDGTNGAKTPLGPRTPESASTPGYAVPIPLSLPVTPTTAPAAPDGTQPQQSPPDEGQRIGQANAAAANITTPLGPRTPESASTPGYAVPTTLPPAAPDGAQPPAQTPQVQTPAQRADPDNEFSNPGTNIPAPYRAPVVKAEPSDDELNQKNQTPDELFKYFSTTNDVNPDRAAAFWQNKKNAELNSQTNVDHNAMLSNDLSNAWNRFVANVKGFNPVQFFTQMGTALGGSADDLLQAFGNQLPLDYRRDLDGKLANNTIGQDTHDQKIALVNQAEDLQQKLIYGKLSPQEQQSAKAQIATLLTQSDPDFAQHQASRSFQQFLTGVKLNFDKLNAVSQSLDDFDQYGFSMPGFDWQKYLTGRDSAASWPTKQLADYFRAHRPITQAISQGESGQIPGWVKGFDQWDIDWKKRMGWLPTGAEYASPEQLAKEGSPISPQRIQDTSDTSSLALQLALDPALGIEDAMNLASSKVLGAAGKLGTLGPPVSKGLRTFWNSSAMSSMRQGIGYYETFFQHDPILGLAWTTGGALANGALGTYQKYGHLVTDILDDAAKSNFEQGGPMSLLSRGARLTSDSIVHSLPYALLNSDGDSNRFWDNLTSLAPLNFAARAVPQVGQAIGTELGDNLFGRLGEFRDTKPIDYPGTDPNLNAHSQANLQDVPADQKNQFATLQHFQNGNTQLYLVTPQVLDDYNMRFGGDAQPRPYGFWVGPDRTGTGQGAAFVLKDRIPEAAAHEATHGIFFAASKADQNALMDNAVKYNDPDQFIRRNYGQKVSYASLPEDPPSADPNLLNKKMIRTEMAVESLKQWFNARNAEQFKDQPSLLRSIRMVAGNWLERVGIPTQTFKSTSEMGINPYFASGLLSDGLWRKAAKGYLMNPKDPRWPVGNWPLNPGDTWDTTGRPPPKVPPTPTTPTTPTTPVTPTTAPTTPVTPVKPGTAAPAEPATPEAPPGQEAIARRAYQISQEREAKGAPGDHVSDWLQAESELRAGKAAPETGPEAPAPETPAAHTDEHHAQLEDLINKKVPAGEAQAIVEGRQPKTLEQEQAPPQMPGRRGGAQPIVSSPKPVWGPGAGIFGAAANVLSPPTAIGAQRTRANQGPVPPNQVPPNQGPETVGTLPPAAPGGQAYVAPTARAKTQQPTEQPAQQPAKQPYVAPTVRQQPTVQEPAPKSETPKEAPKVTTPTVQAKTTGAQPAGDSRTVTSTEFGWVDRKAAAAHPEQYPSGNKGFGDFGSQDLSGENAKGVSIPPEDLQAHFGNNAIYRDSKGAWHASPRFAQMVKNHDVMVEVTNPATGKKSLAPIVDIGPMKSTGAGLDVLHGTAQDIGFTSGKQALSYRFAGGEMPQGVPYNTYKNLADAAEANVGRLNTVQDPGTNGGELACADAVTRIVRGQMHIDLPRTLSTSTLQAELEDGASKGWYKKVPINTPGAIVVSPSQGPMHGHTGIVGKDGKSIYSNSSKDGNWEKNYTPDSWQRRFGNNVYAYLPTDKAPQVKPGEEDKWAPGEGAQGGGGSGGAGTGGGGGGGGGGEEVPYSPLPPMPAEEGVQETPVPGMEEAEREGAATGGYRGDYADEPATHPSPFASMYPFGMPSAAQMRTPMTQGEVMQQAQYGAASGIPPAAPGGRGGLFYMRAPKMGGIQPEEEGGEPTGESTLGQPNVKGFGKLKSLLAQGYAADTVSKAQQLHASLLSSDDTRVKKQADNKFKGEHFVAGDPMHEHMLADLPQNEKTALAAGQKAIADKQPMHVSYISAPPSPGKSSPITRASREVNYDASSPQARLLGQTNGRLAGESMIPTSIGIGKNRAKGMAQNYNGYIQGISTSVAAHNHSQLNDALAEMGQESPYPNLGHAKFRNDLTGYVQNLLAGHKGTGSGYQASTAEYPANPDKKYVPYRLKQREADFLNAVINNQSARHSKGYQELAKAGGTLLNEEGEVNPIRRDIDAHMAGSRGGKAEAIKDQGIKSAANERWSKKILEPTIRTYNAGLIHALHETPGNIPAEIRPQMPGYEKLTETLGRELTGPKGRPDVSVGVHFMPAPLSPEEHRELTGNIRKQFISGKLRPQDYLDRVREVPEPGEPLGGVHYMPMAGPKAAGFAKAEKEGRTFLNPLEPKPSKYAYESIIQGKPRGQPRFEISDQDMKFKPAPKNSTSGYETMLGHMYDKDPRRNGGATKLPDAIDHPELFENYPFLRNATARMDPTIKSEGFYEHPYGPNGEYGNQIVLKNSEDKETMAHEIQHAVQHFENFAGRGTNPETTYKRLQNSPSTIDELNKAAMELPESERGLGQRTKWINQRLRGMAFAMYQHDPGEIEARTVGRRAMGETGFTPAEDIGFEQELAKKNYPESVPGGIAYMRGKAAAEAPPISKETLKKLGPRPEDPEQADLWDKVAARLDTQSPDAIPLEPDRKENGDFKYKKVKDKKLPNYKQEEYALANSPMLQKLGKALGTVINPKTGKAGMAKAPEGTVDRMDELDPENRLKPYLNPTDRLRVSHLDTISASSAVADKLYDYFQTIKDKPEVMAAEKWYDEAEELLDQHFGSHKNLVANLLGATSAGTNVKVNYKMAMDAYHQFLRGAYDRHIDLYRKADKIRSQGKGALMQHVIDQGIHTALGEEAPTKDTEAMDQYIEHHGITPYQQNGKLFGHNTAAVLKVLAHTWEREAGGPKTPNFAANLSGRSLQATIDMWAARHVHRLTNEGYTDKPWRIQPAAETGVNDVDFGLSQIAFRKAAERLGYTPKSLQAILWFAEQKHWQNKGWEDEIDPNDRDYRPMLRGYQRPEDITAKHVTRAEKVRQKTAGAEAALTP